MIEITNLTKTFGTTKAVNGLTVSITSGITGLVGENGAGKSTLLRMIAGVYQPDEGAILIDGKEATTQEAKSQVFFLSDDPYAPRSTIAGVLDFYQGLFDIDVDHFNELIDRFGLPRDRAVNLFSKGMRRQMFVALALSMKATHLLLDEAFDGLDPLVIDAIKGEVISAEGQGKTIIISSHNIFALQRLVDRFLIISNGSLAKQGSTDEIAMQFCKYQAVFQTPTTKEDIEAIGCRVISYKNVGSVTHFVVYGTEDTLDLIKEKTQPVFIESVPLDPDEIVALEMMASRRKKGGSDNA